MPQDNKSLTVRDVTEAYDDAFSAPTQANKAAAAETPPPEDEKPARALPAKDPETGKFIKAPEHTPNAPAHSQYWARKATEVGLSEEDVATMDPEELRSAVNAEILGKSAVQRETLRPVPETPPPEPFPSIGQGEFEFDAPLNKVLKALQARLDQLEGRERHRDSVAVRNKLDALFIADKEFFGTGATEDMDADQPEAIARQMVMSALTNLAMSGKKTTLAKDYAKVASVFKRMKPKAEAEPSEEAPAESNRLNGRAKEWAEGGAGQPTSRERAPLPKGMAKAKATFKQGAANLNETGAGPDGSGEYANEFPGG